MPTNIPGLAAMSAVEMNGRHSLLALSKDGLRVAAFDAMNNPEVDASGETDHGATARAHLAAARDYFGEAVTPDKALIAGMVVAAGEGAESPVARTGAALVSAGAGAVADVVEAIPAAALSGAYVATAGLNALWEAFDGD